MSELFDISESLSPRLAWMRKHGIQTLEGFDCVDQVPVWAAFPDEADIGKGTACDGDTEMEAIEKLAGRLNIKLWNA